MAAGLVPAQRRFVEEYLVDLNATQAALRAGYSVKTAKEMGYENLTKPHIQAAITAAMAERSQRTQVTQDRVIEELAVVGFSNIDHYEIGKTGKVLLAEHAPKAANRAVSSIKKKVIFTEMGEIYETEIKLWNKPATLKLLGDHLGLFRDSRAKLDAAFLAGFLAVILPHIGEGSAGRQAILGYLEEYLGEADVYELTRGADGRYGAGVGSAAPAHGRLDAG